MQLTKWNPWLRRTSPFERVFAQPMSQLFDEPMSRFFEEFEPANLERSFSPAVDIKETDTALEFRVELPGLKKEDISMTVDAGQLVLSGERKYESTDDEKTHRVERWYGAFYRSFRLPTTVDVEQIAANLKEGVLTISIPKKKESQPRQIPVKVG